MKACLCATAGSLYVLCSTLYLPCVSFFVISKLGQYSKVQLWGKGILSGASVLYGCDGLGETTRRANGVWVHLIGWAARQSPTPYYGLPVRNVKMTSKIRRFASHKYTFKHDLTSMALCQSNNDTRTSEESPPSIKDNIEIWLTTFCNRAVSYMSISSGC